MQADFGKDNKAGGAGEVLVRHKLMKKGLKVEFNEETTKEGRLKGDLIVDTGFDTYNLEVKTDLLASETGQIMIEGISLNDHTADFISYVIPEIYIARRDKLKEWYDKSQDSYRIGADKREGKALIISSPQFDDIFQKVKVKENKPKKIKDQSVASNVVVDTVEERRPERVH